VTARYNRKRDRDEAIGRSSDYNFVHRFIDGLGFVFRVGRQQPSPTCRLIRLDRIQLVVVIEVLRAATLCVAHVRIAFTDGGKGVTSQETMAMMTMQQQRREEANEEVQHNHINHINHRCEFWRENYTHPMQLANKILDSTRCDAIQLDSVGLVWSGVVSSGGYNSAQVLS
jgi:hypothetical protein